jgi:hypothetical protein
MKNISVIIPAARSIERIQMIVDLLNQSNDANLQIIVTSPGFRVDGAVNVKDEMVGSSRAIALAYKYVVAEYKYITWLSDICIPKPHCLDNMSDFIDQRDDMPFLGEFRTVPYIDGLYRICTIKGLQYARWGMCSIKTVNEIGFFDELFENYYGDVDLSLRCWKAGGMVMTCKEAVVEIRGHSHPNNAPQSDDEANFLKRWNKDYPAMITEHTSIWNVDKEYSL